MTSLKDKIATPRFNQVALSRAADTSSRPRSASLPLDDIDSRLPDAAALLGEGADDSRLIGLFARLRRGGVAGWKPVE